MRLLCLSLALCAATPTLGAPRCALSGNDFLEGRIVGEGPLASVVDARREQKIEVFVAAPGRLDGRAVIFGDSGVRGRVVFATSGCGPVAVSWRRVEPRREHTSTAAPNEKIMVYANAVVFGPRHGRWIGYDQLEYFETPIDGAHETRLLVDSAAPTQHADERNGDYATLGTMRLAATVELAGTRAASPGADDAPAGQIAARVFRYTLRSDDSFLGWLSSYFNVPYLFGSAGKGARSQAERYIGADCADVLVAALRRSGRHELEYSSVAELADSFERVAGPATVGAKASPTSTLRVGTDVLPGDLLALDYVGAAELPRALDHIVAFVADRGPGGAADGLLGPDDLVADSGDATGLKFDALAHQGEVRVTVLRLGRERARRPR